MFRAASPASRPLCRTRRARPAGLTSLKRLILSKYEQLTELTLPADLTSLKRFILSKCKQLSGLTLPTGLTSLQTLHISKCEQLSDLTLSADLTSLQRLDISECEQLRELTLPTGLTSLQTIDISRCEQLRELTLSAGQTLKISWCEQLSDLTLSADLTSLKRLDISECEQLRELTLPADLTSLQGLILSKCKQLSDLTLPTGLTSLRFLDLVGCLSIRRFALLECLLPTLQGLRLFGCKFEDLPSEVCGESGYENVLAEVRAHYEDLKAGRRLDAEIKVLFLGNGATGKTQLCRLLRGEPFDASVPTTHAIQLSEKMMDLEDFPEPVRLNLWDFGGQEIYHGSHALFFQGQAVFLILWTPKLEHRPKPIIRFLSTEA
jgi:internalin A